MKGDQCARREHATGEDEDDTIEDWSSHQGDQSQQGVKGHAQAVGLGGRRSFSPLLRSVGVEQERTAEREKREVPEGATEGPFEWMCNGPG